MELVNGSQILEEQSGKKLDGSTAPDFCSFGSVTSSSWYTKRRPYRSVAFGTWKVGNASEIGTRTGRNNKELLHAR
ncbi:unnamed protein product [Enterobius vermicularis]|uniref:Uncharacterized protein n=1 Tax=Enterobius vermicularis TaxID=51028 RepID=A0A0N4VIL2_ENTVE|nr:unnamed protein product [Enterobius vermicularis]